jgi:hypothetical protein
LTSGSSRRLPVSNRWGNEKQSLAHSKKVNEKSCVSNNRQLVMEKYWNIEWKKLFLSINPVPPIISKSLD